MRKAIIQENDGLVVNVVEIEFPTDWQPPPGCYCIDAGDASPGDTWNGEEFIKPPLVIPDPPYSTHLARLDAVTIGVEKPAKVTRLFPTSEGWTDLWYGKTYVYDCYVTQEMVDEWTSGQLAVGDIVLVLFLGETHAILVHKVYKTW